MTTLYEALKPKVESWRQQSYPHPDYWAVAEILGWAANREGNGFRLRAPQLRALETYWYLRLVERTPHVVKLYEKLFPKRADWLKALGVPNAAFERVDFNLDALWQALRFDDDLVAEFRLQALRETLTLDYPSYILALAMGAGKTALIGAIIATEFAMALEYPEGPFVENALVFAPGKTILESLRELAEIPYDRILPPRFYKSFAASIKLTFTREGEKNIPVIRGSSFNVVVTNTEKIRIQKETIRKSDIGNLLEPLKADEARAEIANLRLQAIASLPHLAVFSDEAHHTYGQALDTELKKVRKTVDYLAANTNVVCVVNTTGTPYFRRQPLRDVVIWYGLSEGIRDGILKEIAGNIYAFSFDDDSTDQFVAHVIEDFLRGYGHVKLPNGAPAKLALYFPQTDDLEALRPIIETKLAALGYSPAVVLRNTNESSQAEIDAFNRLNDPASPHRVILLVNKGTEGWNCPSLFACALARRLRSSNNFVLQAASRSLRQVPGNTMKARIYLSMDNRNTLDRELQETYGETIADLNQAGSKSRRATIRLRKLSIPPLVVKQVVRTVVRRDAVTKAISLATPTEDAGARLEKVTFDIAEQAATRRVLKQIADAVEIEAAPATIDLYSAAVELAAIYRLDLWAIYDELARLYSGVTEMPAAHLADLARQIEEQTRSYEVQEEAREVALALVKPDGFTKELSADGTEVYTAEISYPIDREHLLLSWEALKEKNAGDFGFHYTPYNFDSNPEKSFFEQLLEHLNLHPAEVEDIYFTGALTDPNKTDFSVEYKGDDGKWHRYTPDFVVRRKDGKCLIVEVKREHDRAHPIDGEQGRKAMATRKWVGLNPDRLKYQIIFTAGDTVGYDQTREAREFVTKGQFGLP
jgi:hypothetical protein